MTGKPAVLQFMGSQRVRHNLETEQKQKIQSILRLARTTVLNNFHFLAR